MRKAPEAVLNFLVFAREDILRAHRIGRDEIYVVDDDPVVRDLLSIILGNEGYDVVCFADGDALLAATRGKDPLCIFLDLYIPGRSGLEVLKHLHASGRGIPVIMMSGAGDIATAVDAVKHGAFDFVEKPFRGSEIVARLNEAVSVHLRQRKRPGVLPENFPGRDQLTTREIQVLAHCVLGESSKETAKALGISPRTVEDHRSNVMRKVGARSAVDLTRIVMGATAA